LKVSFFGSLLIKTSLINECATARLVYVTLSLECTCAFARGRPAVRD
jgi:hypothetical protein